MNADGAAILDVESGEISNLNGTGAYIWSELTNGRDATDIVAGFAQRTGKNAQDVEDDVRAFLDSLRQNGLLAE
jgi:hypothetical protein